MASSPPPSKTAKRLEVGLAAACNAHAAAQFKKTEREEDPNTADSRKTKDKMAREKRERERHYYLLDSNGIDVTAR
eukprot:jgi/Tetstr1/421935/TSEL_012834.t1